MLLIPLIKKEKKNTNRACQLSKDIHDVDTKRPKMQRSISHIYIYIVHIS
jgi:hypothetical protein